MDPNFLKWQYDAETVINSQNTQNMVGVYSYYNDIIKLDINKIWIFLNIRNSSTD